MYASKFLVGLLLAVFVVAQGFAVEIDDSNKQLIGRRLLKLKSQKAAVTTKIQQLIQPVLATMDTYITNSVFGTIDTTNVKKQLVKTAVGAIKIAVKGAFRLKKRIGAKKFTPRTLYLSLYKNRRLLATISRLKTTLQVFYFQNGFELPAIFTYINGINNLVVSKYAPGDQVFVPTWFNVMDAPIDTSNIDLFAKYILEYLLMLYLE